MQGVERKAGAQDAAELIPVTVSGHLVYVSARQLLGAEDDDIRVKSNDADEEEISAFRVVRPTLEHVLDGAAAFAAVVIDRFKVTDASKVTVQFGCEMAVESGQFVAVIGKASSKSTITVGLEWTKPTQ